VTSASRVTLSPEAVVALFGKGYRWRGSEHVRLVGSERGDVSILAIAGARLVLEVDRLDRSVLGGGEGRLIGPRGSIAAPPADRIERLLVLPQSLLRAWRLEIDQRVVLQVGSVIFADVTVAEGQLTGAALDRTDLLAAGVVTGATARIRRDVEADEAVTAPDARVIPGRLITENDVRQARLRGRRVLVQTGQKITPAALSLGKELGVLDWPE
jgi:hypothetical protein